MIPLDLRAMELTTKAAAVVLSDLALRMAAVDVHQAEGIRPLLEVDLVAMGAKEPPCAALPAFEPEARVRRELTTRLYRAVARAVFVAYHIVAITLQALPAPAGGMSRTAWKEPTVQGEIASFGAGDMAKSTYDTNNDGKVNAADDTKIRLAMRSGVVDWQSQEHDLLPYYTLLFERLETDPDGVAPWDEASVNAMEIGIVSAGTF